jgi:hypothetical protein
MQIDTLSQINEVINSLVKKGNLKQANNLNKLFIRMAQEASNSVTNNSPSGTTADASGNPTGEGGGLPPTTPPEQKGGPNQAKPVNNNMMDIIKQFIALQKFAKEQNPPAFYAYSRGQFTVGTPDNKTISAPTVGDLFQKLNVSDRVIDDLVDDVKIQADKITSEIASASSWTDASPEASQAINDKYDLGFNFENNKYYIADPKNSTDVQFGDTVAELQNVYNELGTYFEAKKSLPPNLAARKGTVPEKQDEKDKSGTRDVDVNGAPADAGEPTNMNQPNSSAESINSQILA